MPTDDTILQYLVRAVDAAKLLLISDRTLFTLTKRGELACIKIGNRNMYDRRDLAGYVERRKVTHGNA